MKKILPVIVLLSLLLMSCGPSIVSNRISYLPLPKVQKRDSINVQEYATKYPKYDGVFLDYERIIDHSGRKMTGPGFGWQVHFVKRLKYIVLNPDNQKLTTFELNTGNFCELGNLYISISSPDGTTKLYRKTDLNQQTNSNGAITYKFIYPDIKKGSIIEEGVELSYNSMSTYIPPEYGIDLQFQFPCEKFSFKYAYPNWWKVKTKKTSSADEIKYKITQDSLNRKSILHYYAENIPAVKDEPYSPYFKEMAQYLDINETELLMGGYNYISFNSWEELGSAYKKYVMNRNGFLTSRVSDVTEEVIKGCRSDYEKLNKIITYIQQNIEEVHDGIDRNFADILKNKKGSTYGMTGLAHSMLIKAGLNAEFVLIHSASEGYFDPGYISVDQFSIPAVRTVIDNKEYVVQPYEKYYPVDYIPDYIINQPVLIISNERPAVISQIGSSINSENSVVENYDLNISEDGKLLVKEEKSIKGAFAFFVRSTFPEISDDKKDKFIKDLLTYSDGDVKINKYEILNMDSCNKPLVIKFDYEIDNLVTLTPEEVVFQTGGLFSPSSLKKTKIETDKRQNPIRIYYSELYNKNISISFPESWKVQNELADVNFENSFGKINGHYDVGSGTLKVTQQQKLKKCSAPKEKIMDFIEISGSKSKLAIPTIIFKKTM